MSEIQNSTAAVITDVDDLYSPTPPAGWDTSEFHPQVDDEAVQPEDEYFKVLYEGRGLTVIRDGATFSGHLDTSLMGDMSIYQLWDELARVGLLVTRVLRCPAQPGTFGLRFRTLTTIEKELIEYSAS